MECREVLDRLSPYLDDELDPVSSAAVAAHLGSCPQCTAALARLRALGEDVRREVAYGRAPDSLRELVARELRAAAPRVPARPRPAAGSWRWLGAAAAIVAVAGGAWLATGLARERADDRMAAEVVSGHVRSLMASHLTDVASTDQHTVKPWFAGRLDFSPPVTDFASAGFPLAGGRLDYLAGRPVAALVYTRHRHVINVFLWPGAGGAGVPDADATARTRGGFHLLHGARGGMNYWVVSDLNPAELVAFTRLLAASAAQP